MNTEAQRIAIAELCGWKCVELSVSHGLNEYTWYDPKGDEADLPPDYPNDLNAINEAEKTLNDYYAEEYYQQLCKIGQTMDSAPIAEYTIHASAAQRAEALLRTLNLWKE